MPLGAARLSFLAKSTVTAVAEVIRRKVGVSALFNAQVDTAQSKFGGASAYFDGVSDVLETDSALVPATDDFTVEMWVRIPSYPTESKYVWSQYAGGASGRGGGYIRSTTGEVGIFISGGASGFTTTQLSTNTWYHLAWVRSGNDWEIFIDGVSSLTTTSSVSIYTGVNTTIGARDTAGGQDLNGWIDEVRISDTARYTTGFTPSTTPFVNDDNTLLLLHMDGTDGSTFFDDDNGVGRSPLGVSAVGNAQVDTAQSYFGGASALFDGVNDYLLVSNASNFGVGTGDFTYECWFRNTTVATMQAIWDARPSATNGAYPTLFIYQSKLSLYYNDNFRIQDASTLSNNTWYHVALVRSGSTITLYKDGTSVGTYSDSTSNPGTDEFRIGIGNSDAYDFNGHIDEFRVSDTARYTSGFTPSTAPFTNDANTLLLVHCDGTDASTVFRDDNGKGRADVGISANGNAQVDTADSKFGGASALFDGAGDYLYVEEDVCAFGTGDFTIEAWINLDTTGNMCIIDGRGSGTSNYFIILSSKLSWSNGSVYRQSTSTLSTGTWYHVAVSRSSGTLKLFIDGTEEGSWDDSTVSVTGDYSYIGRSKANTIPFDGHIDELRISDTGRYTTGFTPSTESFTNDANTLLLVHMNGTDGSTTFIDDNGTYSS